MSEDRIPKIVTHLVGSIGEVVAKHFYNLDLITASSPFDARTREPKKRSVQIKLTAGSSVAMAVHENDADLLIVLHINRKLGFEEIYNGDFPTSLLRQKKPSKRLVKSISLHQLRKAEVRKAQGQRQLDDEGRILKLNSYFQKEIE